MSEENSYRQILRSTSIIGGASVVNILVGLLRTKVVAVLLGPAGLGLIALLQSLMNTATAIAALGFANVGTRQIAESMGRGDPTAVAAARRALFWGTLLLAIVGAAGFWLLRGVLASDVLKTPSLSGDVGWLALGVALTVAAGSQGALLNGLRRIGDIARVSIASALLSTVLGVGALLLWGKHGMLVFVLATPLASFLFSHIYVARLGRLRAPRTPLPKLAAQWTTLARLGLAFMLSGVVVTAGQLIVRAMINSNLGPAALGHFQASWAISMTYIGFVLGAMGTDYYPRLTAAIHDHATVNRLVNEQTEVALLLAGPVFLAMLGLAPWVIDLLYSSRFEVAAQILRWQILGDILKVASWPLGFILLAAGDGRAFLWSESVAMAAFAGLVWLGLLVLGIQAAGVAFLGMYVLYLPLVHWLARRRTGFSWDRRVIMQLLVLVASALVVFAIAAWSVWGGAALGVAASMLLGIQGLARLGHMANLGGPLERIAVRSRSLMMKLGVWRE